jgi:putative transposase
MKISRGNRLYRSNNEAFGPVLTVSTEIRRTQGLEHFRLISPFLENRIPLTRIASTHRLSLRTLKRWVKRYRSQGLSGLIRGIRRDRGQRRSVNPELQKIIEGLALLTPKRTNANIHRETLRISEDRNWLPPSYSTIKRIVQKIDPPLVTLAHEGSKAYSEEFDLIYRHQASTPNEVWQSDHSLLPIFALDEQGKPTKPWLTIIFDDYSRAVTGYHLGFASPSTQQTALTLHQAIWRKADPRWHLCGIPARFYTDNGSDFTSHHLEHVAADLKMELVFSWPGHPRGRGKIERFFRTVEQLLLPQLPGFAGAKGRRGEALLTLEALDAHFQNWLLNDYHQRDQAEINSAPQARWEAGGFLPRMPESLEQLDLLLLHVAKTRRVQQDGIHFQGQRYFDTNLAAYVGEDVTIRYNPRDLAVIRVFYEGRFICSAVCREFAETHVSLKDVIQARRAQRKRVREAITDRISAVEALQEEKKPASSMPAKPSPASKLKRYYNE